MKVYVEYNTLKIETEITPTEVGELISTVILHLNNITPRQVVLGKTIQNALMQKAHGTPENTNASSTEA